MRIRLKKKKLYAIDYYVKVVVVFFKFIRIFIHIFRCGTEACGSTYINEGGVVVKRNCPLKQPLLKQLGYIRMAL